MNLFLKIILFISIAMIIVNLVKVDFNNFSLENNAVAFTGILSSGIAAILISILIISKKSTKSIKKNKLTFVYRIDGNFNVFIIIIKNFK